MIVLNNSSTQSANDGQDTIPKAIQDILQEFDDIFKEPIELPPHKQVAHAITLLDDNKFVNQRPYRLPFHQKNAMEELIKHMLLSQMIRPSISPYSFPMIMIKKKDGTWRLCVDYR